MKHPKRDSIDAAALKSRIDLHDLVESVWSAVYADGFKDFGAGLSDDHFDFLQHEYGMDFPEALAWLIAYLDDHHLGSQSVLTCGCLDLRDSGSRVRF